MSGVCALFFLFFSMCLLFLMLLHLLLHCWCWFLHCFCWQFFLSLYHQGNIASSMYAIYLNHIPSIWERRLHTNGICIWYEYCLDLSIALKQLNQFLVAKLGGFWDFMQIQVTKIHFMGFHHPLRMLTPYCLVFGHITAIAQHSRVLVGFHFAHA